MYPSQENVVLRFSDSGPQRSTISLSLKGIVTVLPRWVFRGTLCLNVNMIFNCRCEILDTTACVPLESTMMLGVQR
jgi:hypothetical protein